MPRTLAAALRRDVSSTFRARGEHYYRTGRVVIDSIADGQITASVRGSSTYSVLLRLEPGRLVADCSCPFLTGNLEACKHVWATILAADERRLLSPAGTIYLHVPGPGDDDLAWMDDDGDYEVIHAPAGPRAPRAAPARSAPASRPASPPVWQQFLEQVAAAPTPVPRAVALLTGELVYVFDPLSSRSFSRSTA